MAEAATDAADGERPLLVHRYLFIPPHTLIFLPLTLSPSLPRSRHLRRWRRRRLRRGDCARRHGRDRAARADARERDQGDQERGDAPQPRAPGVEGEDQGEQGEDQAQQAAAVPCGERDRAARHGDGGGAGGGRREHRPRRAPEGHLLRAQDVDAPDDLPPVPGLVDPAKLKPADIVGVNKDSYLSSRPCRASSTRASRRWRSTRSRPRSSTTSAASTQIQELIEAVVLPMTRIDSTILASSRQRAR